MMMVRLVKVAMVASCALFALLVAFNNLVDYGSNAAFVRHTLSMDTTFPNNVLKGRAITSPTLWTIAYWSIIAAEAVTGLLLALATLRLAVAVRGPASDFNAAKQLVVLGMGLGFQFPIVVLFLVKLGYLTHATLAKYRRHVCVASFILGAVLTTPEVITQVAMAIPLYLLYEICIWIAWYWERKKRRAPAAAPA